MASGRCPQASFWACFITSRTLPDNIDRATGQQWLIQVLGERGAFLLVLQAAPSSISSCCHCLLGCDKASWTNSPGQLHWRLPRWEHGAACSCCPPSSRILWAECWPVFSLLLPWLQQHCIVMILLDSSSWPGLLALSDHVPIV